MERPGTSPHLTEQILHGFALNETGFFVLAQFTHVVKQFLANGFLLPRCCRKALLERTPCPHEESCMQRRAKPDGGFRFIRAYDLLGVYFAYTAGLIRWYDVRVWFACQEAVARRCGARKGTPAKYTEEEIRKLVGAAGERYVRGALKRLQSAGLLTWSENAISSRLPSRRTGHEKRHASRR